MVNGPGLDAATKQGRRLRVVLYDPSGRGGVCQYTYNLAEHLAGQGAGGDGPRSR